MTCGDGTQLVNGVCVPVDGGTGGSASGGSSGSGGTGGAVEGGSGQSGAAGDAGHSGSSGVSGARGGSGGTADDAGPGLEDEPCPSEPLSMDCSGQCGVLSPDCALGTCQELWPDLIVDDPELLPFTFRTPSHPGVDPACEEWCSEPTATVYGLGATFYFSPQPVGVVLRAQVDLPWRIVMTDYLDAQYCEPNAAVCAVGWNSADISFQIVTDDPNAPARNVTVELVDKPGSCP